ncbi:hypothetical protein FB451DRAFT_1411049 [Mycena latifolia]|nr:hypothetical protein FB451DRAFT_1411049 [Mycena latifolia]
MPPPPGFAVPTPSRQRQPLPDLSLLSTPGPHANSSCPGVNQVPREHDSSHPGWAEGRPEPSPGALIATRSRHHKNPTTVQSSAGDHEPIHHSSSHTSSPVQTLGVYQTAHHLATFPTAQIFDLVSKPLPRAAWAEDSGVAQNHRS